MGSFLLGGAGFHRRRREVRELSDEHVRLLGYAQYFYDGFLYVSEGIGIELKQRAFN